MYTSCDVSEEKTRPEVMDRLLAKIRVIAVVQIRFSYA
jgi:hypothetical protein